MIDLIPRCWRIRSRGQYNPRHYERQREGWVDPARSMVDSPGAPDARPAMPRPSSVVILVRQAPDDLEVFMLRRRADAASFADVYVFPGGTVSPDDYRPVPSARIFSEDQAYTAFTARGSEPPASRSLALALWRSGVRELFEETGVLLAVDVHGLPPAADGPEAARLAADRQRLQRGEISFAEILARWHLSPEFDRLHYFSHWISPSWMRYRYDTRFFIAALPQGQTALFASDEASAGLWITPRRALGLEGTPALPLVFPTRKHLERLAAFSRLETLLDFADRKPVRTVRIPGSPPVDERKLQLPT